MSIDAAALYAMEKGILDAIEARLAVSLGGEVQRACVVPGALVAWDECECGTLTVHQRSMWPSQSFPLPVEPGRANCAVPFWAVQVVVTLVRCAPTGVDDDPPTCDALETAATIALHDMEVMQRGAACALVDETYRVQDHTTLGPEGGCVGSELVLVVAVPNCTVPC